MVIHVVLCRHCRSQNVIGHWRVKGVQRFRCRDCGRISRQDPGSAAHPEARARRCWPPTGSAPPCASSAPVFGASRQMLAG